MIEERAKAAAKGFSILQEVSDYHHLECVLYGLPGHKVSFCGVPGTGEERIPNWYYDSEKNECSAFIFSGSEGNANRFETQEQCDRECGLFRDQV